MIKYKIECFQCKKLLGSIEKDQNLTEVQIEEIKQMMRCDTDPDESPMISEG